MPDPAVLTGVDSVFDLDVDPMHGIDVGGVAPRAAQACRGIADPQAAAVAVSGLKQGQLATGVGQLVAGGHSHAGRPAVKLVPTGPAKQPGQLGDVRRAPASDRSFTFAGRRRTNCQAQGKWRIGPSTGILLVERPWEVPQADN